MELKEIVEFWGEQTRNSLGQWVHPTDDEHFRANQHSFNLDFPVSPYVGDILSAPIIILGANAGYSASMTPSEFPDEAAMDAYLARVRRPSSSDWSFVSTYYGTVNYGPLLVTGKAALINACPYRSPKISEEPENKRLLKHLPSVEFTRRWLLEAVMPLADAGQKLVIAKRPGLWRLPAKVRQLSGVVVDPAPVSPQITGVPWAAVQQRLQELA